MRTTLLLLACSFGVVLTGTGCTRHGVMALNAAVDVANLATDIAATSSNPQTEWTTADDTPSDDEGDTIPVVRPVPPHVPASAADTRIDRSQPFNLAAAYGALAHVDLGVCKDHGLSPGYGRVVLGFANDGSPVGVGVDLPAGSRPEARACVEHVFQMVRVAPFDGAPANVRRAFFVEG